MSGFRRALSRPGVSGFSDLGRETAHLRSPAQRYRIHKSSVGRTRVGVTGDGPNWERQWTCSRPLARRSCGSVVVRELGSDELSSHRRRPRVCVVGCGRSPATRLIGTPRKWMISAVEVSWMSRGLPRCGRVHRCDRSLFTDRAAETDCWCAPRKDRLLAAPGGPGRVQTTRCVLSSRNRSTEGVRALRSAVRPRRQPKSAPCRRGRNDLCSRNQSQPRPRASTGVSCKSRLVRCRRKSR